MPAGRPSIYTPELAQAICERLAKGESLKSICRDDSMPHEDTVRTWTWKKPEFSAQYAEARDQGLEAMADDVITIADDGTNDWVATNDPDNPGYKLNGEHVNRSRLRVDTRKWYLSKLAPKRYGDRIEHVGAGGKDLIPETDGELARRMLFLLTAGVKATEGSDGQS